MIIRTAAKRRSRNDAAIDRKRTGTAPAPCGCASAPPSQVAKIAQKLILDHLAPASVLIDSSHEALYFCGPTDEFLAHPRGAPTRDLLILVREGLRSRLRALLRAAAENDLPASVADARMKHGGHFTPVQITVTPSPGGELGRLFLVVFRHAAIPLPVTDDASAEGVLVRQMEEELQATRDDLQSTIESFEATYEKADSIYEELSTINRQLEARLSELDVANRDLRNLLNSSDVATIRLDRSFHIESFTPSAQEQFRLIAGDIGRPISDFTSMLGGGGLIDAAAAVLARRTVAQHQFETESGGWYVRRVLPYRDEDGQIDGVVVTFTDITGSRLAIEAASAARQELSDSHERRVRERTDKLRALSAALAMAEERERRALAQDLHDDLGQMLAVVRIKVAAMEKLKMTGPLRRALDDCVGAVDQTNRKLRAMAFQLSPPMLYELGLIPALDWMAEEMHHVCKLNVHTADDGEPKPLDPAVSATLFRAVRELLINVAKHAGVETATVTTARGEGNALIVTVSDDGAGFDPDALPATAGASGFGLLSVRERLGFLGGDVTILSNPGIGTSVILRVPLLADGDAADLADAESAR